MSRFRVGDTVVYIGHMLERPPAASLYHGDICVVEEIMHEYLSMDEDFAFREIDAFRVRKIGKTRTIVIGGSDLVKIETVAKKSVKEQKVKPRNIKHPKIQITKNKLKFKYGII